MARIKCRTPSTGKPLRITLANVPTTFTMVVEAPDFSIPDASTKFADRDPDDASRAIRPGEVFFLTPMSVRNKSASTAWVESQLVTEANVIINFGRVSVPAGDTVFLPFQGRSLLKRDPTGTNGDRLEIRAENVSTFDIWTAAEEKLSSEHTGVEV